ncbi:hypothetical protein TUM17387_38840 [Shewanella carassii]|uniref:divergent polysaccharide deacetylase family protein n=1 Tax=Shewanella carassii TaxID=1987584 RepID=UPI001BF0F867|nr:divergent polysaccharide deacetylase family protein [Shewanella carassii]BCV68525.1 hypothetical protein TUM17387_38840 [Shewanella carassii]
MRYCFYLLLLVVSCSPAWGARLAIVIDDIGYRHTDEAALSLPSAVTLSVLPHTPLGQQLARQAHSKGHEIMVHLPMQALNGKTMGPGGLNNQMSETEFKATLKQALQSVPFARGSNNHMGSLLTQLEQPMGWLMEVLQQEEHFFIDSVTTRYTKAGEKADALGVPLLRRQVFLDNQLTEQAFERQLDLAIAKAQSEGEALMIAHPYPESIQFLKKRLPELAKIGVTLVPASSLLPITLAQKQNTAGKKL